MKRLRSILDSMPLNLTTLLVATLAFTSCSDRPEREPAREKSQIGPRTSGLAGCAARTGFQETDRVITLLGTNDLHGAIEPTKNRDGDTVGGLSFFSGVVSSVREGLKQRYSDACGGMLLLDGGDQFQGTLLSNFSEGQLMFDLMSEIGYDAVVPGNHDYDFGPLGWLYDQVEPGRTSENPREVIEKLASSAKFPLLSANTYLKNSLRDITGKPAEVKSVGCTSEKILDWSGARRPDFLKPYVIKEVAGVRVALIGLDNIETPTTTTPANVSDLCFRDPVTEYLAVRREIADRADVFVILVHAGDANGTNDLSKLLKGIQAVEPDGVDAIIGGHTHMINEVEINGVPAIQSGANGMFFGRIDLVFDTVKKKVDRKKTKFLAGALLKHQGCDPKTTAFCSYEAAKLSYEKQEVKASATLAERITAAKNEVNTMGSRHLGVAEKVLVRDRYQESPLGNALADALRESAGVPVAFINTGGIRANIAAGKVTYTDLYTVLPFNNHAVVIGPMKTTALLRLVRRSMQSCGGYGALVASGLRVTFSKDCGQPVDGADPKAKLLTVHLDSGEKIFDGTGDVPEIVEKDFQVATLDFLSQGGSGYDAFKGYPVLKDLGIFREALADKLESNPARWNGMVDGRWQNVNPAAAPTQSSQK